MVPEASGRRPGRRRRLPWPVKVLFWLVGIIALLLALAYVRLLFGPLDISFAKDRILSSVRGALPPETALSVGSLALSVDDGFRPVVRLSPVTFTDHSSGAVVHMQALEIGFSPLFALIGQPGAMVTLVGPHVQVVQDLLGPRLASFKITKDPKTGEALAQVLAGPGSPPAVRIRQQGLTVSGKPATKGLRSDNDWLIYNMDATEQGLANLIVQARAGRFSRLSVKDGTIDMLDPVYGLVRDMTKVSAVITPAFGHRPTRGRFGATIGDHRTEGTFTRTILDNGEPILTTKVADVDFATLLPFLDDTASMMAVRGAGHMTTIFTFSAPGGVVTKGDIDLDLSGTFLRIKDDLFPIEEAKAVVHWQPDKALFTLDPAHIRVGQSSADIGGQFALGFDPTYGPMVSLSLKAHNLLLAPNDLPAPRGVFTSVSVSGWSAPLYGALGLDRVVVEKPGAVFRAKGRIDMVRKGIGVDVEIGGEGASADDLKRLWPYFIAPEARDWFVQNVGGGKIVGATAKFKFPVGSLAQDGTARGWVKDSAVIDMVASNVVIDALGQGEPVRSDGPVRLKMRDGHLQADFDKGTVLAGRTNIGFSNADVVYDSSDPDHGVLSVAGDVGGSVPAILSMVKAHAPGALSGLDLPFDPGALSGDVSGKVKARFDFDPKGDVDGVDYAVDGSVAKLASATPIAGHRLGSGRLDFTATPAAFTVSGDVDVDDIKLPVSISGTPKTPKKVAIGAVVDTADLTKMGIDVSQFLGGKVALTLEPIDDGLQVSADLTNASLSIKDLGLGKAIGVPGSLEAVLAQDGTRITLSDGTLGFGTVRLKGGLVIDLQKGLESANFTDFALGKGDQAELSVMPTTDGYAVKVTGEQLDLRPMLTRYFALDATSTGGPKSTAVKQTITADVELKRAVGFYQVTAYNFALKIKVHGEDLRDVSLQAQFAEGNNVSITTNQVQGGQVMTAAVNQAGTLLRFLNVYPRLLGGTGSLILRTDYKTGVQRGDIRLKDFSIVDEAKVAEILGNHRDSQALIKRQNRISFNDARARFTRRSDRIELTDVVLDGGDIGGTLRGFIYTKKREYDLTGTYVPLFALNSIFQKIPLIGPLLGGRQGEGLVGVTFAIRGSLDKPRFVINPASLLLPGVFRALTEFRAKEAPREAVPTTGTAPASP